MTSLDDAGAVFIGGDTDWKSVALGLGTSRLGTWLEAATSHAGRVNSDTVRWGSTATHIRG